MSDDPIAADPNWSAVARFLEGRIARGQRVNAPRPFARVTGSLSPPDPASVPDWAIVHKGQIEDYPAAALRRIAAETTPVFANDVFVVFARRPTFGLRNLRGSVHVNALYERVGASTVDGVTPTAPATPAAPSRVAPAPIVTPPIVTPPIARPMPVAPALPPEALALLRSAPAPTGSMTAWDGLRTRIAALLAERPAPRMAEIGIQGVSSVLGAYGPLEGGTDAAILRVTDAAILDEVLGRASSDLSPDGRLVVIADNDRSLGRRLARAANRPTEPGLSLADLRAALHAAGFRPIRAGGLSLDPWRGTGGAPPPDQEPGTPGGDILDAAGADAGPDHAAFILLLALRA